MRLIATLAVLLALAGSRAGPARAQSRTQQADVTCPSLLGVGVATQRSFCDVLTGRDPAAGALIEIPPHAGPATLRFDLHNRHTFSEDQIRAGTAYAAYTAIVGVLTMDGKLLRRAGVQSEFRAEEDLLDRVGGGAGPGGVKAVAPVGTERIELTIPAGVTRVSVLGETLEVVRRDGRDFFNSPGRPIAIISNVEVAYRPASRRRR